MGKIGLAATKYIIRATMKAEGTVERPDVIGAVFGQTEGLLGEELDLRELQKGGRIGRIEVEITTEEGKSTGTIEIPTSLSKEDTALIAAALETIERVGPCDAKITLDTVDDIRSSKRDFVVDRAKAILEKMGESVPESQELSGMVREKARVDDLIEYGPDKLTAGPTIESDPELIIVEGRADVIALLKAGITNAIAIGGTSIPQSIKDIMSQKTVTVFVDGDRGGDLKMSTINFVAKAPTGLEVEELTQKDILKCLRAKVSFEEAMRNVQAPRDTYQRRDNRRDNRYGGDRRDSRRDNRRDDRRGGRDRYNDRPRTPMQITPELEAISKLTSGVKEGEASLLKLDGTNFKEIGKVSKADAVEVIKNLPQGGAQAVIIGWPIDPSFVNECSNIGIKYVIGSRKPRMFKRKPGMYVFDAEYLSKIVRENGSAQATPVAQPVAVATPKPVETPKPVAVATPKPVERPKPLPKPVVKNVDTPKPVEKAEPKQKAISKLRKVAAKLKKPVAKKKVKAK